MYDVPENQARDWVDDWKHRAERRLEETQQMATRMEKLSITRSNSDETVNLTVDSAGIMTKLELAKSALSMDATKLAAEIIATQRKAQNALGKAASMMVKDTVGLESATGQAVMNGFRKRFGKKALEERYPQPGGRA